MRQVYLAATGMNRGKTAVALTVLFASAACGFLPGSGSTQTVAQNLSPDPVVIEVDTYRDTEVAARFFPLAAGTTKVIDTMGHLARGPALVRVMGLDCQRISESGKDPFPDGGTLTIDAEGIVQFDYHTRYPWATSRPRNDDELGGVTSCEAAAAVLRP